MANVPDTSTTLLRDVAGSADNPRWSEFVARYRPMMEAFMRERFPSLEADDIIQETLVALCRVLPSYRYALDKKGHFHNYLTGILRNKALRQLRKDCQRAELAADLQHIGITGILSVAVATERDPPTGTTGILPVDVDDQSYRESLFELALRQFLADGSVADRTKRIFERTAINGEAPEVVAAAFKMTRHAVDQAKSRAMARLREIVKGLETLADG